MQPSNLDKSQPPLSPNENLSMSLPFFRGAIRSSLLTLAASLTLIFTPLLRAEEGGAAASSPAMPAQPASEPAVGPAIPGVANPHSSGEVPLQKPEAKPLPTGEGELLGKLVPGGAPAPTLEDFEVRLFAFENQDRVGEWRTLSGPDGSFRFEQLATRPTLKYIVSVMYQSAVYLGESLSFADGARQLTGEVKVFGSTFAPGPLELDSQHFIVESDAASGAVRVTEVIAFNNPGEQTLVGGEESTTTFSLDIPAGYTNLEVLQGLLPSQVAMAEKSLAITGPFYPGVTQVVFSYTLGSEVSKVIRRRFPVPVKEVDVFVRPDGPAILSPQLAKGEPLKLQDTNFLRYTGSGMPSGGGLSFQIGGVEGESSSTAQLPGYAIAGVIILGTLLAVLAPFFRRGRSAYPAQAPISARAQAVADLIRERDRQLAAVKEAEYDFQTNKLTQADFEGLRARHRALAIEAMKKLAEVEGNAPVRQEYLSDGRAATDGSDLGSPSSKPAPEPVLASEAPGDAKPLKFCTACGVAIQPGDKFCGSCGATLRATLG